MKFDSLAAFLYMGGHGLYIWAAYALTLMVVVLSLWWPRVVRRRFVALEKRALLRADNKASHQKNANSESGK